ncbi:hypothetical protein JCGZ_14909 [Jatropha curcas]|uniref:Uncharacterized protein n=1 Tax=Jatropha curcas TaxID=180498 RepID=A0A067LC68_JATCU|nr:hypothetical protein JCGZ_14909 [Jatropha curcas]
MARVEPEKWVEVGRKARTVQGRVVLPRHEDVPKIEWGRMSRTNSVTVLGPHQRAYQAAFQLARVGAA